MQTISKLEDTFTPVRISRMKEDELVYHGVPQDDAKAFCWAREYVVKNSVAPGQKADTKEHMANLILYNNPEVAYDNVESMWLITLTGGLIPIAVHRLSIGTENMSITSPAAIMKHAIMDNATQAVLVHNHPSGDNTPSESDLDLTEIMGDSLAKIGTTLVDSIIITGSSVTSLRDRGDMVVKKPDGLWIS